MDPDSLANKAFIDAHSVPAQTFDPHRSKP